MAAAAISRRFRNLHQLRALATSTSSPSLTTQPPIAPFRGATPFLPPGAYRDQELKSLGFCYRYFCTGAPLSPPSTPEAKSGAPLSPPSTPEAKAGGDAGSNSSHQHTGNEGIPVRKSPVSWMSFVLLLVTGAGLVYYYDQEKKRHIEEINNAAAVVKEGPSVGKASIGGPFNLINDHGKAVTEKDFMGKWSLIYFGFTHCPDICPEELVKLAAAIDKIKEKSGIEITPIFISVDPERDTVEQVHEYVKEFHPKLVGLTGSPEEIRTVARSYRVYYMKAEEEEEDYLVDHSIVMYLMNPSMEFVKFFGKSSEVDTLTNGVINVVRNYKK